MIIFGSHLYIRNMDFFFPTSVPIFAVNSNLFLLKVYLHRQDGLVIKSTRGHITTLYLQGKNDFIDVLTDCVMEVSKDYHVHGSLKAKNLWQWLGDRAMEQKQRDIISC